jgi:hypothetical protein
MDGLGCGFHCPHLRRLIILSCCRVRSGAATCRYQRYSAQVASETKSMCMFALARHLGLVAAYEAHVLRLPRGVAQGGGGGGGSSPARPSFAGHWHNHTTHGLEEFLRAGGTPAEMCSTVARMEAEQDELVVHDGGDVMNLETTRWGRDVRITQAVGQSVMHVFCSPSVQDQVEWHQARWEGTNWVVRVHRPNSPTDLLVRRYVDDITAEMVVTSTTVAKRCSVGGRGATAAEALETHVCCTRRYVRGEADPSAWALAESVREDRQHRPVWPLTSAASGLRHVPCIRLQVRRPVVCACVYVCLLVPCMTHVEEVCTTVCRHVFSAFCV